MALEAYHTFKGIDHFGEDTLSPMVENNLVSWYNWAFLQIGAWTDVTIPQSGAYGGDFSKLRLVNDPQYTNGQVWEAIRKDWVWETGVNYVNGTGTYNPIQITGVQVNGTMYGTGDATYGHYYNYPLGRVVFDTALTSTDVVKISYSYRNVQVYKADDVPWWQNLQYNSFRPDDTHFTLSGSGDLSVGGQHRIQLPAIIIATVPVGKNRPYEIGAGSLIVEQDVLFYTLAEEKYTRDKLIDIARNQDDKTIWLFNTNSVAESGDYPLDYRGMYVGGLMYPNLVDKVSNGGHRWRRLRFEKTRTMESAPINMSVHEGVVRSTCEVIFDGI